MKICRGTRVFLVKGFPKYEQKGATGRFTQRVQELLFNGITRILWNPGALSLFKIPYASRTASKNYIILLCKKYYGFGFMHYYAELAFLHMTIALHVDRYIFKGEVDFRLKLKPKNISYQRYLAI